MKKIFICGSSGYFKENFIWINDFIKFKKLKNYTIKGIIDDNINDKVEKFSKLKFIPSNLVKPHKENLIYIAAGNIKIREKIIKKFLNYNFFTLIHPSSVVSKYAKLGKGITIGPQCVISANANLGDFNNLNSFSLISHDNILGTNNSLSPYVKLMGNCKIGSNNFFGANTTVLPNISLGNLNNIGANSLLTKNFSSNKLIYGSPAKIK